MRAWLIHLLLITCISQLRHLLATPQPLHKRMLTSVGKQANALGRRGLRAADPAAEILRQSAPTAARFPPDCSLTQVWKHEDIMHANLNAAETAGTRAEDFHPTITGPSSWPIPTPPTHPPPDKLRARLSKAVRQKLSDAVARRTEFLRREKPIYRKVYYESDIAGPGPFDNPFKQETNPLHPLLTIPNRADLEVDDFFKELEQTSTPPDRTAAAGSTGTTSSSLREKYLQHSPATNSKTLQQLKEELHHQLIELDRLLKHESELENYLATGMEVMALNLRNILSTTGDYAIPNLVEKMSEYKSAALLKDQKLIKSYLPKDQRYLTRLIGFLGPKNVLGPVLDEAMRSNRLTGAPTAWLSHLPEDFTGKVTRIQEELGKLVAFNQEIEVKTALGSTTVWKEKPNPSILNTIQGLEKQLIEHLGGRDNLKIALDNIAAWDTHKWLMREIDNPYSTHGLLLQLIEPWGYMRQYSRIPAHKRPYMEWGIKNEQGKDNLMLLDTYAPAPALHVIQEQLNTAAELRNVEANINRILTPEGIKAFTNSAKKQT